MPHDVASPGLVRWAPVEGATAYEVWYPDIRKVIRDAHERRRPARVLHASTSRTTGGRLVEWRVRAGAAGRRRAPERAARSLLRALEPDLRDDEPRLGTGKLQLARGRVGLGSSTRATARQRTSSCRRSTFDGRPRVSTVSSTGSSASYVVDRPRLRERRLPRLRRRRPGVRAPRLSGPLKLPDEPGGARRRARAGDPPAARRPRGRATTFDGATDDAVVAKRDDPRGGTDRARRPPRPRLPTTHPLLLDGRARRDRHGRRGPGRSSYYGRRARRRTRAQAGRVASFGKESRPGDHDGAGTPYVSGLSPKGRLLAQAGRHPVVYSTPLVAWQPVVGATAYEVQWSRTKYPWRARGSVAHVRDLVGAPARPGHLVLPRPRPQRRAGRHAGDDLVGAGRSPGRPADLPDPPAA